MEKSEFITEDTIIAKDNMIFAIHIDIGHLEGEEAKEYVNEYVKNTKKMKEDLFFFLPNRGEGTKIECLNPKFIFNDDMQQKLDITLKNLNRCFNFIDASKQPVREESNNKCEFCSYLDSDEHKENIEKLKLISKKDKCCDCEDRENIDNLEDNKVEVMIGGKMVDVEDLPFNPFTGFKNY